MAGAQEKTPNAVDLGAEKWLTELKAGEKNAEKFKEQGRNIVKTYLDRREGTEEGENRVNLFTTNTNILMATLYARIPKPMVTREYEDTDDDIARVAAMIAERCLTVRIGDDFDCAVRYVVQDRLVPGIGTVWFRYEPTFKKEMSEPILGEFGEVLEEGQEFEVIDKEKVCTDYVFWEDLNWSPVRVWEDMSWISRKVKMTKEDATGRFGEVIAGQLKYSSEQRGDAANGEQPKSAKKFAMINEIWCKLTKKVYWVSEGCPTILDTKDDPLGLKDFWPCPRFLTAMMSTSNYMPRADYLMAQDQYKELNDVNNRITKLEQAIRVVGIYDGNNEEIGRIFTEGVDNKIIPNRSMRDFMEKGGFKNAIDWFPIEPVVNALDKLRQIRQDLVAQIYEVTGISDIMRGSSKASETLGAQQLKAQYSSVKLQHLQMEVATFVQRALDIKLEIISKHFDPQNILAMVNPKGFAPEDQDKIQPAIELIKSQEMAFRIEVHADSMAVPEFNAERDGRMGLMRAIAEMMTAAAPILDKDPKAGIGMLRIVSWAAASFRTGREIEGILDNAIKSIETSLNQPKPPAPDPVALKAQAEEKAAMAKLELEEKIGQAKLAMEERMNQQKLAFEQQMATIEANAAQQLAAMKQESEARLAQQEAAAKQQTELLVARIEAQTDVIIARIMAAAKPATATAE